MTNRLRKKSGKSLFTIASNNTEYCGVTLNKQVKDLHYKNTSIGTGEMAQWLIALTALPEDSGSIPALTWQFTILPNTFIQMHIKFNNY